MASLPPTPLWRSMSAGKTEPPVGVVIGSASSTTTTSPSSTAPVLLPVQQAGGPRRRARDRRRTAAPTTLYESAVTSVPVSRRAKPAMASTVAAVAWT